MVLSKQMDSNNGPGEIPLFYCIHFRLGIRPLVSWDACSRVPGWRGVWQEGQGEATESVGQLKRWLGGDAANDFVADLIEGQNFFSKSGACRNSRHAPDDAACFALDDHEDADHFYLDRSRNTSRAA